MPHRKPLCRWTGRVLAVLALLAAALWALSAAGDRHAAWGRWGFGLARRQLELIRSSEPMTRQGPVWSMQGPSTARFAVNVGPTKTFFPSRMPVTGSVGAVGGGTITYRLTAIYVPLLFTVPLLAGAAASLLWLGRRGFPAGHCLRCGYDLGGLGPAPCPECGHTKASSAAAPAQTLG